MSAEKSELTSARVTTESRDPFATLKPERKLA
jgi:hypothetical protein